ncbi:MAG: methyltransferase family protein, partial [Candidatus Hodarchaeales archaeon]
IIVIPLTAIISLTACFTFLLFIDTLSRLNPTNVFLNEIEFLLLVLGPVLTALTGWIVIFMMWYKKEKYLAVYKERAYQRGIFFGMLGIPLVLATIIHVYLPVEQLLGLSPVNKITIALSSPIIEFPGVWKTLEWLITVFGSLFFLLAGMLTGIRSLFTFGIDYMGLVYLYYPEESEVQNHGIYSVVRHPAYLGLMLVALGGVLARLSIYSITSFIILLIGFTCHIRLVEERELIKRFGSSFLEYRRQVPALYIKPEKILTFFRFLLGKK